MACILLVCKSPSKHLLKTWEGRPENVKAAQDALLTRAKANSLAQLGKYTGEGDSNEAKKGMRLQEAKGATSTGAALHSPEPTSKLEREPKKCPSAAKEPKN
ncbi:unnamed protein product [Dovyalis caffra]|uniref:fructose-bisphosphate aldolase n=1 Tax=Dovyalis caffra TaxID=77055 RepID=A0AAV1RI54_9ROSI|nr:unnamed protein product [Dovyalis caffra]